MSLQHWRRKNVLMVLGLCVFRLLNATRYVLCLDNVASTSLTLHTPKIYKDPEAARFLRVTIMCRYLHRPQVPSGFLNSEAAIFL